MITTKQRSAQSRNLNHPQPGTRIKVEPIRERTALAKIKTLLGDQPRNACLFSLGINTACRAGELMALRVGQVQHLKPGDTFSVSETKTGKNRTAVINRASYHALQLWLSVHPCPAAGAPLFISSRGCTALSVPSVTRLVKSWCRDAGLKGNYGSHSMRKTFGFHRLRDAHALPPHMVLPTLMKAYGHATQQQTLDYLCIQSDEVTALYMAIEL